MEKESAFFAYSISFFGTLLGLIIHDYLGTTFNSAMTWIISFVSVATLFGICYLVFRVSKSDKLKKYAVALRSNQP